MHQAFRTIGAASGLAIALLAAASPSAVSAEIHTVRALTAAYDQNTGFNVSDTGFIVADAAAAESGPFTEGGGSFHAKASASFLGPLGPTLHALSEVSNTIPINQPETPAQAWWSETVDLTGLPAGSQITALEGFKLSDLVSDTVYPGYPSNLGAVGVAELDGTGALAGLSIVDSSLAVTFNKTVWRLVTFNSGDVVTFGGTLVTNATAQGGAATADAFDTGLFAFKILTPGADYTTATGGRFLTSFDRVDSGAPEPATYALLIAGFGLLGLGLRRRRALAI